MMEELQLDHVDSHYHLKNRGTWRHPNGEWHELDYMMASAAARKKENGPKHGNKSDNRSQIQNGYDGSGWW